MKHARLDLARSAELLPPLDGIISVFGPIEVERLRGLDAPQLRCVSNSYLESKLLKQAKISVALRLEDPAEDALVFAPRAKAEAWQLISEAIKSAPNGWIIVDGQKTDGIDSIAKQIARHVPDLRSYSKGHGKTVWFRSVDAQALIVSPRQPAPNKAGFLTAPGVFSSDDIDPASELLMEHVPDNLSGKGADLGAGWGYISARLLVKCASVASIEMVEDNAVALECARENVKDGRANFHWADALSWAASSPLDFVIMNPPFHKSRSAEPALGVGFIQASARALRPGGKLYMVANGHLPYESALELSFDKCELIARTSRFKVFCATRGRGK